MGYVSECVTVGTEFPDEKRVKPQKQFKKRLM
ncbi:MAG: hypothetical protein CFH35_00438 [Alphaproteobacteria bacterium MarineAlpha9_Bin5]|nr:MAG: hypothetical protein CFH36_00867 [Alphaproteobacteria bacterium MarineAlpha9_Bin6]PPR39645.1 MAG: hypothetical protein CFH35_00438 [Alphaproteobacteria bacterium MarineAlpha9_Bin5]